MTERQQYYKELIAHLIERHFAVKIDLTLDTEVPLPNVRLDMVFEIPKRKLSKAKESPFPYVAEVNLFHIKAVNDRLTREDVISYLGELYILATSQKAKDKSVALTILSAEKILPSIVEGLRSKIEATEIPWISQIAAEEKAYIFTLECLPKTEEYRYFLPFQALATVKAAKEELLQVAQKRPHTDEEALMLFYLKRLQPKFFKEEIEMAIDMEEIVKELCPKTLQRKKNEGVKESIIKLLQIRFGFVPQEIKEKLESITTEEALEILLNGAATEQTLDEFKKLLE